LPHHGIDMSLIADDPKICGSTSSRPKRRDCRDNQRSKQSVKTNRQCSKRPCQLTKGKSVSGTNPASCHPGGKTKGSYVRYFATPEQPFSDRAFKSADATGCCPYGTRSQTFRNNI
jgi:hypothetical protein